MKHASKIFYLCLGLIAASVSLPLAAAADRPNILFIMSDDHCTRGIGVYGERLAKLNPTPVLDKLAAEGVVFDNVFCTNSICTPSRANIITGQHCQTNGVRDLYDKLDPAKHYLPKEMKKAGYTTAIVGKWHLKYDPQGFDYFCVIPGQGKYFNTKMYTNQGGTKQRVRFSSVLSREVNTIDFKGHSSDIITDVSLEWLEKGRDKSKPFFLMHHFKAPHDMFQYHERYNHYLDGVEIPEPANLYDQPARGFGSIATRGVDDQQIRKIGSSVSRRHSRNLVSYYTRKGLIPNSASDKEATHLSYQNYVKDYLRCVKGIDDNLKRILDYLKKSGLDQNTIIFYTGDQGMMLGEHDFIDKRWMYEESMRMPLIAHFPKQFLHGKRSDWVINNTDFAPTLISLAGGEVPDYMHGRSFAGALKGEAEPTDWRKGTYYRYWMHMAHGHNNPAHFGLRAKKHKLIFFYGCDFTDIHGSKKVEKFGGNRYWQNTPVAWEFYDLEKDPQEMKNQYENPEYKKIIQGMKDELVKVRKKYNETDDRFPRIQKIIDENWDN